MHLTCVACSQVKLYRLPKTPDYDRAIITGRRNDKLFGTQRDRTSCSPTTTESSTTEAMTSESWQGTANADFAGDDSFWAALHSQGLKMEENRYETEDEFSSLFDFDGAGDQTVSAIDPKLTMLSESV